MLLKREICIDIAQVSDRIGLIGSIMTYSLGAGFVSGGVEYLLGEALDITCEKYLRRSFRRLISPPNIGETLATFSYR